MNDKPSLDELAHYGVKGMRWGMRKARTGQIDAQTRVLDKVASGTANRREKLAVASTSSVYALTRRGLAGEAARRSTDLKAQKDRLAKGEATVRDILLTYHNVTLIDLIRARKD